MTEELSNPRLLMIACAVREISKDVCICAASAGSGNLAAGLDPEGSTE